MTDSGAAATGWLIDRSLEALAAGQHPSGALIASPDFRPYHFCWVRDGTFCAYALDRWGRHQAAARFYRFVAKAINDPATLIVLRVDDRFAAVGQEAKAMDIVQATRKALIAVGIALVAVLLAPAPVGLATGP